MLLQSNFNNIIKTIVFGHVGERRPIVNDWLITMRYNLSEKSLKLPDSIIPQKQPDGHFMA